jgi:hypothetical protein
MFTRYAAINLISLPLHVTYILVLMSGARELLIVGDSQLCSLKEIIKLRTITPRIDKCAKT